MVMSKPFQVSANVFHVRPAPVAGVTPSTMLWACLSEKLKLRYRGPTRWKLSLLGCSTPLKCWRWCWSGRLGKAFTWKVFLNSAGLEYPTTASDNVPLYWWGNIHRPDAQELLPLSLPDPTHWCRRGAFSSQRFAAEMALLTSPRGRAHSDE